MLLAAQRTPHPSANLGQMVDTVCVDSRGKFTTRAWTPHHQSGHQGGLPALRVIDPIPAREGNAPPTQASKQESESRCPGFDDTILPQWSSVIQFMK